MAKEKWAKAYVRENIKETGKGYICPMPPMEAYPGGAVPMKIGKPVDPASGGFLLLAELLYEFNKEVTRRKKSVG